MDDIITISHLKKSYGDVKAVDDISFNVERGSLFAFLGINGAGKSTTINILCTLLAKDEGEITINNHNLDTDAKAIKNDIGIVFQEGVLDKNLTVKANLAVRASFYGLYGDKWKTRLNELSDMLDLSDIMNRNYGKLSGGQRRRVDIARAIINKPKILFLDEPTTGLDPKTRQKIWEIVTRLQTENNTTIFLTTHYMEEADSADNVVIIDRGHIIATGTPAELKNRYSGVYLRIYSARNKDMDEMLMGQTYVYDNGYYSIKMTDIATAKAFLIEHSDAVCDFEIIKGNMDDVFLVATGRSLGEADYE